MKRFLLCLAAVLVGGAVVAAEPTGDEVAR
jgi:hypothetical protein